MKRKILLIQLTLLAILLGCATTPPPPQQQAMERILARTAGYALASQQPKVAKYALRYVDTYLLAESWQAAAIQSAVDELLEEIEDPFLRLSILDILELVTIPEVEELQFDEERLRNAMVGFQEGLRYVQNINEASAAECE